MPPSTFDGGVVDTCQQRLVAIHQCRSPSATMAFRRRSARSHSSLRNLLPFSDLWTADDKLFNAVILLCVFLYFIITAALCVLINGWMDGIRGNWAVRVSRSLCSSNVHHTAFPRPPVTYGVCGGRPSTRRYMRGPNGRSFGDAPLNDVLSITGGSTPKSAGKAACPRIHIRKSDQVVRRSSPRCNPR